MERKRIRDLKFKAAAMSSLAGEAAQLSTSASSVDTGSVETKIFINPYEQSEAHNRLVNQIKHAPDPTVEDCDSRKRSRPDKQSLVTFKIPPHERARLL